LQIWGGEGPGGPSPDYRYGPSTSRRTSARSGRSVSRVAQDLDRHRRVGVPENREDRRVGVDPVGERVARLPRAHDHPGEVAVETVLGLTGLRGQAPDG